ncbi:hypothetical protein HMPREF3181_00077 [Parvimonas sp. KA00067]|uniref:hypothetical protein n=1 Tax=Parvimonas sp. KA00067 TaxID=1588755 RepID=UPI00061D6BC7|nr:hypothetical protein [Parvimonas sp. KA00067]KXB67823.1 hypothetical protein HMPREF3181_00077 [Parvimonas sp. KA00067]
MSKLYKMSLEELWQIFPIFLVEHNIEWKNWYEEEKKNMKKDIKIAGFTTCYFKF